MLYEDDADRRNQAEVCVRLSELYGMTVEQTPRNSRVDAHSSRGAIEIKCKPRTATFFRNRDIYVEVQKIQALLEHGRRPHHCPKCGPVPAFVVRLQDYPASVFRDRLGKHTGYPVYIIRATDAGTYPTKWITRDRPGEEPDLCHLVPLSAFKRVL